MYHAVKPCATHFVMFFHAEGNPFGSLLRELREREGLRQEDVADVLGVDRTLIAKWEKGDRKRPVTGKDIEGLHKIFPEMPVLQWLSALGFPVSVEGFDEEAAVVAQAYQDAGADRRLLARLALQLEPRRSDDGPGRSLRRLAAKDRPDRQGNQE